MRYLSLLLLLVWLAAGSADDAGQCKALEYAAPGYVHSRERFPPDLIWNDVSSVAFPRADCTWLAANFRDTGSSFVAIFFGGYTAHKETWPYPWLAHALANRYGISSLVVDPAGRGESCGYEVVPGYADKVKHTSLFLRAPTAATC